MVIHVIFAFASVQHNGTPSRCSTVTVITTLRASVGMRSEFWYYTVFHNLSKCKMINTSENTEYIARGRIYLKSLSSYDQNVLVLIATEVLFCLKWNSIWVDFWMPLPKTGGFHLLAYTCGSHMSKPTWWKRKFKKRCSATSRFRSAYMQNVDLHALNRSWVSAGLAIMCVSNRTGGQTVTPPPPPPPPNITATTTDRQ